MKLVPSVVFLIAGAVLGGLICLFADQETISGEIRIDWNPIGACGPVIVQDRLALSFSPNEDGHMVVVKVEAQSLIQAVSDNETLFVGEFQGGDQFLAWPLESIAASPEEGTNSRQFYSIDQISEQMGCETSQFSEWVKDSGWSRGPG